MYIYNILNYLLIIVTRSKKIIIIIIIEVSSHRKQKMPYLVRFGGAGACFPFLFVERLICTILLLFLLDIPPVNVLSFVTELVVSTTNK